MGSKKLDLDFVAAHVASQRQFFISSSTVRHLVSRSRNETPSIKLANRVPRFAQRFPRAGKTREEFIRNEIVANPLGKVAAYLKSMRLGGNGVTGMANAGIGTKQSFVKRRWNIIS